MVERRAKEKSGKHTESGESKKQKMQALGGVGFPVSGYRLLDSVGSSIRVHPSVRDLKGK